MDNTLFSMTFNRGERVEVSPLARSAVYGFGRVECEANARPGWYYIRFPQGELELIQWTYLVKAPQ